MSKGAARIGADLTCDSDIEEISTENRESQGDGDLLSEDAARTL
jgi:hypothetical protein